MATRDAAATVTLWVRNADGSYRPMQGEPVPGQERTFRIVDPDGQLAREIAVASEPDVDGPPLPEYGPGEVVVVDEGLRVIGSAPEEPAPSQEARVRLKLYLGVRYFSPTAVGRFDLRVSVDGQVVADGEYPTSFEGKSPDQVALKLAPGRHVLTASTSRGQASFTREFTLSQDTFALLDLNHCPAGHPSGAASGFTFEQRHADFGWR